MKYGNKTTRLESNICRKNMKKHNENKCFFEKYFSNTTFLFCLAGVLVAMFLSVESANAQSGNLAGYVVQPGRIDFIARPRSNNEQELRIHNFDPNSEIKIDFKIIELTQKENGEWLPFDTDPCSPFDYYPGLDISKVSSCKSWIKMEKLSVTVPKDGDVVIPVRIDVPYNAKTGFYGATIMASTRAKASESERVPMVIRTGIPVVTSVQLTPTLVSKVEIQDVGMEFIEADGPVPGKVLLTIKATNKGLSFPRLKPIIRLRGYMDKHWKLITTHEFDEIGIIPGVGLTLKSDIGRSLPSGKYQLDAILYVDGMLRGSKSRMAKEIEFKGDPLIGSAVSDVPLDLDLKELIFETSPGKRLTMNIKVHGAVGERIEIVPVLDVPKSFKGIAGENNEKLENELTCQNWLSFEPKKLVLEEYRTRNLSITAEMPENAIKYSNYYANLGLKVVYPDGQVAGTTWMNVCVKNINAKQQANVKCTAINLTEINASKSTFLIQAKFENNGNSHIAPSMIRAAVVKAEGLGYTSAMLSTDKAGMFMPYEKRYYTGILDFSSLDPDDYNIEVLMDYPTKQKVSRQVRVRVRDIRGRRVPEILNEEVKEPIQVQWVY